MRESQMKHHKTLILTYIFSLSYSSIVVGQQSPDAVIQFQAIKNIAQTAHYGINLILKMEKSLERGDAKIAKLDSALNKYLLENKNEFETLSYDTCTADLKAKYWESKVVFGKINPVDSHKIDQTTDPNRIFDVNAMFNNSAESMRLQNWQSDKTITIKLRIFLKEFQYQLSCIDTKMSDCQYRSKLLCSYMNLLNVYYGTEIAYKLRKF
jgi:hypothetical protein